MNAATLVVLGLMTALLATVPAALADSSSSTGSQCEPVWIDGHGNPVVDTTCLPAASPDPAP